MGWEQNKFFYEERPYAYAVIGGIALLFSKNSQLAMISGIILVSCAVFILFLRKLHRSRLSEVNKKHQQFSEQKKKNSVKFEI